MPALKKKKKKIKRSVPCPSRGTSLCATRPAAGDSGLGLDGPPAEWGSRLGASRRADFGAPHRSGGRAPGAQGVTARSPGPARPLWRGNSRLCASWARAPCRAAACYKNHPRRGAIPGPLSPAAKEFRKSNLFPDCSRRAPLCSEISLTVETPADIVKAFLAQKKSRLLLGPRPGGSSALAPAAPPGSLDFPAPVGTRHGSSSLNKNH